MTSIQLLLNKARWSWMQVRCMSNLRYIRNDDKKQNSNNNTFFTSDKIKTFLGLSLVSWTLYEIYDKKYRYSVVYTKASEDVEDGIGIFKPNLPCYTLDEVAQHREKKNRIWVTYKQGVYDITKFVEQHPGGDNILLAAGGSVEPFWLLYAAHNDQKILKMMENMRIGNISAEEAKQATSNMNDPYETDPRRHPALVSVSKKPFNAETPLALLVDSFVTPADLFYVRNHLPVPDIDPKTYELEIEIEGIKKTITLSLDYLKTLPKHSVTATIMCAGNRRSEMSKVKSVKGLNWGPAAVGNAVWSGPLLRDILLAAGLKETDENLQHVQFEGFDTDPTHHPYGASIPLWRALDKRGDVILAYEMNGQPLPRDHGFPVRVIVPGVVGARNVKWLGKIKVSSKESDSHWQQNDYKGFSPSVDWDTVDFSKSPAIQELPVMSAVCIPQPNDTVLSKDGFITIKGYAWSGNGQKIVRVDVTIDEGKTWHVASFDQQDQSPPSQHWAWTLWSAHIPVTKLNKQVEIWVKAVDSNYNTQPENFSNIWNLRGVLSNAYHRVPVNVKHQ